MSERWEISTDIQNVRRSCLGLKIDELDARSLRPKVTRYA
jgi:hypothetical protein